MMAAGLNEKLKRFSGKRGALVFGASFFDVRGGRRCEASVFKAHRRAEGVEVDDHAALRGIHGLDAGAALT